MSREPIELGVDPEEKALEEELRRATEELRAAESAREKQGRLVDMREQIEVAQRKKAEEVALAAAIEQHGPLGKKIARVDIAGVGMFIVRRPDPIKIKKLFADVQDEKVVSLDETFETARSCLVYPTRERADALYAETPLIANSLSSACLKLAGMRLEKLSGK